MGHKARRAQTEKRETGGYREFPERMESVLTECPDQKGNRALSGTTDQGDSKEKSDHLDQPGQKAKMDRPGQWDLRDLQGKEVKQKYINPPPLLITQGFRKNQKFEKIAIK